MSPPSAFGGIFGETAVFPFPPNPFWCKRLGALFGGTTAGAWDRISHPPKCELLFLAGVPPAPPTSPRNPHQMQMGVHLTPPLDATQPPPPAERPTESTAWSSARPGESDPPPHKRGARRWRRESTFRPRPQPYGGSNSSIGVHFS